MQIYFYSFEFTKITLFKKNMIKQWKNGKWGALNYMPADFNVRFAETNEGGQYYLYYSPYRENTLDDYPIVAHGIVAIIFRDLGRIATVNLFKTYYDQKLKVYLDNAASESDAYKRNLPQEFPEIHLVQEQKNIVDSGTLFDYLSSEQCGEIKLYYDSYLDYVQTTYMIHSKITDRKPLTELSSEKPLTLAQIALICVYQNTQITMANATSILEHFECKSIAIRKLMHHYNVYMIPINRTGDSTPKSLRLRMNDVLIALEYLKKNNMESHQAKEDYQKLQKLVS